LQRNEENQRAYGQRAQVQADNDGRQTQIISVTIMKTIQEMSVEISPFVGDSGICDDDFETILTAVNSARSLLWKKLDYSEIMEWCQICCVKGSFLLPPRYEVMRQAIVCGNPVEIKNQWYQTVPGVAYCSSMPTGGLGYIEDRGGYHSKFRDYTANEYRIELVAESSEDAGKVLQFLQQTKSGRWKKEEITIADAFLPSVGENLVVNFSQVSKPETVGGIRVYAVDAVTGSRNIIALYQPWEINPKYKRYTVPGYARGSVLIYGKTRMLPLKNPNDLVEFPEQAMIHAISAISYRKGRDQQRYISELSLAISELQMEMQSDDTQATTPMKVFRTDQAESLVGGYFD